MSHITNFVFTAIYVVQRSSYPEDNYFLRCSALCGTSSLRGLVRTPLSITSSISSTITPHNVLNLSLIQLTMGNLCSKSGDDPRKDNFAGPGRVLGSAPPRPENARATIPPQQPSYGTTGQTLGGGRGEGTNDAKAAAARAAEVSPARTPGDSEHQSSRACNLTSPHTFYEPQNQTRPMTATVWL